ncbi:hypothetical protein LJB95_03055, partial [Paludibacteraceae bacterium OttesenSCG-928-F17]|nr:hypothetical protein [Paludibacteraceae bacterium OttesenSCG-928-F17]
TKNLRLKAKTLKLANAQTMSILRFLHLFSGSPDEVKEKVNIKLFIKIFLFCSLWNLIPNTY